MPTVYSLHLYPVKGMRGIDLPESRVEPRGLSGDRRWMVVGEDNRFLSQRNLPRLCLFRTGFVGNDLAIEAPGGERMLVPPAEGPTLEVYVHKETCVGRHVSDEVDAWLTQHLEVPARLVYMADETFRQTRLEFTRPGDHVGFADAFPVLVASLASLEDLNSRLDEPVPMNRFRANIIVDGCGPFDEDTWSSFELGGVRMRAAKTCGRCLVTTTDQETAEVGTEPLRTLATYRLQGQAACFGNYFVPENSGTVAVGQELKV